MTQNKLIGITGGIGSGKSTVAKILKKSFPVINMDDLTSLAYSSSEKELEKEFGKEIFIDGKVDKKALGKIVFADEKKLKKLNDLLHPKIIKETLALAKKERGIVFVECPLLFEANLENIFDEIWLVVARYEKRLQRIISRDDIDEAFAERKMASQSDDSNKIKKSDIIIHNDGDLAALEKEVSLEIEKLIERSTN